MVKQDPETPPLAGPKPPNPLFKIIGAFELFNHHSLNAQVRAPHLFDEFRVVDAFDPQSARAGQACRYPAGVDGPRSCQPHGARGRAGGDQRAGNALAGDVSPHRSGRVSYRVVLAVAVPHDKPGWGKLEDRADHSARSVFDHKPALRLNRGILPPLGERLGAIERPREEAVVLHGRPRYRTFMVEPTIVRAGTLRVITPIVAVMDYRVEELADAAGIAVDTVRFYQRRKLLHPPRREGRRAVYDHTHLERVREIRRLADRGFSLAQIRDLATADATGLLNDLAAQNAVDPDLDKAELARRANVPEFLVDVVVSAGLLTPVGDNTEQRFSADSVDMVVAARTLVSEGVSLEELTALALRHATHVEDVIDDAIEVFKRHRETRGGSRDELIALLHRLVPVASTLVGQHFERTLRTRALARLGQEPTTSGGGVVVFARKLDERIDPVAVYSVSTDSQRVLWVRPDAGLALVALGAAHTIEPYGDARFSAASAARAALAARVRRHGPADAPAPVLVGGFSFSCGRQTAGPDWTGFPDARWVLAEVTVIDRPDGTWLLAAAPVKEGEDEAAVLDLLEARLEAMAASTPPARMAAAAVAHGAPIRDDPEYVKLVAEGVDAIAQGQFAKVVLARVHRRGAIAIPDVLHGLVNRYPSCAVFAFGIDDRVFLGATPEELVLLDGREVKTAALAGTTGRGGDKATDEALGAAMLASVKVRAEHQFVVDNITERLATLGLVGETLAVPEVLSLARVQHLRTPITARVERRTGGVSDMDVLRVASVLHPTPAVAGTPTDVAVAWLRSHESFDRGWYAGPVGWCDLDGNGELRVALRSALVEPNGVHLFSGAGVITDSVPEDELAETAVKLRALLDVMEAGPDA